MKRVIFASTNNKVRTVLKGTEVSGNLYDECTYEELVPALNCIIDMKDRIAAEIASVNSCQVDPDTMYLSIAGGDIFIYFTCSLEDYIQGRHLTDKGLIEYLRSKLGTTSFKIGGNLAYFYNPGEEVSEDAIWDELTRYKRTWMTHEFRLIEEWISDYYTTTSGRYNQSPKSFSWAINSLFGRNYAFPETGDFVSDVDSCYRLFDAKVSRLIPNFELNVDRQVDPDDDEDFEDVLKFKFSDATLKTRLSSSELKYVYDSKGCKGVMSILLRLIGRLPNKVKVIRK